MTDIARQFRPVQRVEMQLVHAAVDKIAAQFGAKRGRQQVLAIVATREGSGIGTALLQELEKRAKAAGAAQVRLSTTNENFTALRFCQMRGYRMRQLIPGAFEEAKKLKGIPSSQIVLGHHDIEIRDEIILNKDL